MHYFSTIIVITLLVSWNTITSQDHERKDHSKSRKTAVEFKEINSFPDKNRRKWHNPVLVDLDQDGYQDVLLTDHGYAIKLYWNNKGTFSKGIDLIVGDTHGIGVGDYDADERLDLLIARGGGSGTNARNTKIFHVDKNRIITEGNSFNVPLRNLRGRTNKLFDGDNDGDLDLVLMGFPSKGALEQSENFIYKNDGKGDLAYASDLPKTKLDGQKILITDFDNDFVQDLLIYGDGRITMHKGNGDLTYFDVTDKVFQTDYTGVTGIVEIDYDNDGDFDLYLTRGKPLRSGETFFDKENKRLFFYHRRGQFQLNDLVLGDILRLTNYQSAYPHQDIHIGESAYLQEFTEEYHSGQNFKFISSNALGWPDNRNNKGFYLGYVGNASWRLAGNSHPAISAVIHGVDTYPKYAHSEGLSDILLENNNGKFRDITKTAQLQQVEHTTGVTCADYNNDGFQDLFVVKRGNPSRPNKQLLFLNTGKGTFRLVQDHNLSSKDLGAWGGGTESIDYNLDGFMDIIFSSDLGTWHLFENIAALDRMSNYSKVAVGHSPIANASMMGALVTVTSCGKKQQLRIGSSGAPYSQSLNSILHFGIGNCTQIEEIKVRWSNGEIVSKTDLKKNTYIQFKK